MALAIYTSAAFANNANLEVAGGADVEVRKESDAALATIYSDRAGNNALSNPFQADSNGRFEFFAEGRAQGYRVTVTDSAGNTHTLNYQPVGTAAEFDAETGTGADTVALRDSNGRVQTATSSGSNDALTKGEFDDHSASHESGGSDEIDLTDLGGKPADLATHENNESEGVHGSTSGLSPNKLVHRDGSSRAQFNSGGTGKDAVVHDDTDTSATADKIVKRDGDGKVKFSDGSDSDDGVTKSQLDAVKTADIEDDGTQIVAAATAVNYRNNLTVTDDGDGTATVDASSGTGVDVEDDGTAVVAGADPINFGSGLTVSDDGDGSVTVDASSGGGITPEDDGTEVIANASAINFGTGLSVADDGDGSVTVDNSVTAPDVEDDGTVVVSGPDSINFGSGLSVADDGDGSVTVTTSGSSGVTGPTSSTDNALARFDGTGGGTIQDSGVLVSDDDELYGHGQRIDFKTSDFTLAASDAGKNLDVATGSEATVTIPNDSNVSLPVGYSVGIVQGDSNAVTVSGESDVTIQSKDGNTSTNGQWSAATLYKRDTDEWVLIGDLA